MWCGHTLEHLFADGWSTASHKRKMTLLEAPTGTFLWQRYEARHCALVTVIWFVEEVGDHHGKETGLKCDFDSIRKKWTFGSGSLLCQRFWRRCKETAWKRGKIETSLVIVMFILRVLSTLFLMNCFEIKLVLCDLYVTRFVTVTAVANWASPVDTANRIRSDSICSVDLAFSSVGNSCNCYNKAGFDSLWFMEQSFGDVMSWVGVPK